MCAGVSVWLGWSGICVAGWTKNNTTNVVIQQNSCKLLMMDILNSETCWAHKKWSKIASDIKLVFYSSTITMMHGLIYISFRPSRLNVTPSSAGESSGCLNVDWKLSQNRGKPNIDTSIQASEEQGYPLFFMCLSRWQSFCVHFMSRHESVTNTQGCKSSGSVKSSFGSFLLCTVVHEIWDEHTCMIFL